MHAYLKSLLPKVQKFSKKLDNTALLVDKKWIALDNEQNHTSFIFRGNGDLLTTKEGNVIKGKWEYIPDNNLLIERGGETVLLNHGFFDDSLLVLKRDGTSSNFEVLSDPIVFEKLKLAAEEELTDPENIVRAYFSYKIRKENLISLEDLSQLYKKSYVSKDKEWIIYQRDSSEFRMGDIVYLNDLPSPNGVYIIGKKELTIKKGKIVEIVGAKNKTTLFVLIMVIILAYWLLILAS